MAAEDEPQDVKKPPIKYPDTQEGLPRGITDNDETDIAVTQISNAEADKLIANEDSNRFAETEEHSGRLANFFSAWLGSRRGRHWTLATLFVIVAVLSTIPSTRYWLLNAYGVRASANLTAIDGGTQLPLQGATARIGGDVSMTDSQGNVTLRNLKLGPGVIKLTRPGYASTNINFTVGWGENPLGNYSLKDIGQQYTVELTDYVSDSPIKGAEVSSNGLNSFSNAQGIAKLTVSNSGNQPVAVTISDSGYRTEGYNLLGNSSQVTNLQLVPAQKEVYIADQSGSYDLYSCNVDGSNQQLLLAGTPTESSNLDLSVSPDGSQAALVSTRDTDYDSNGKLLNGLVLVNVNNGDNVTIDHAEAINLLGWIGTDVIYEIQTGTAPSISYSIISYNYATSSRNQLASSPGFSGIMIAGDSVYYTISASTLPNGYGFYSIQPDGSNNHTILNQDSWSLLRTGYNNAAIQAANGWYSYTIGNNAATLSSNTPADLSNRQYVDSADGKYSAWFSTTDSSTQLLVYNINTAKDSSLPADSNAIYPLRWIDDNYIIYRDVSSGNSADYIVSTAGGAPKKIVSDINTQGALDGS